jgi:hypothetical protein
MKMFQKGIVTNTNVDTDNKNIDLWIISWLISFSNTNKSLCPHNGFFQVSNADPNNNPVAATSPMKVNNRNEDVLENRKF